MEEQKYSCETCPLRAKYDKNQRSLARRSCMRGKWCPGSSLCPEYTLFFNE